MFQSSAHPKEDRNGGLPSAKAPKDCFNPRPTRRKTETITLRMTYPGTFVSILGPPEGRPKPAPGPRRLPSGREFQSSAHPKEDRNTLTCIYRASIACCFNPRPTRRKTETPSTASQSTRSPCFNPRPTRRKTETTLPGVSLATG